MNFDNNGANWYVSEKEQKINVHQKEDDNRLL